MPKKRAPKRNRDGVTVADQWATKGREEGKRWRYRVRDPYVGKYVSACFNDDPEKDRDRRAPGCAAGDAWAAKKRAAFGLGLETAATVTLRQAGDAFLASREHLERSEGHRRAIEWTIAQATAAGIADLSDPDLATRTQRWLSRLKAQRPGQKTEAPVSTRVRNHHIAILRSIGGFACRRFRLLRNPFDDVERYAEARKARPVYTLAELRAIVSDDARWPHRLRAATEALVAEHSGDVEKAAGAAKLPVEAVRSRLAAEEGSEDNWWRFAVLAAYTGLRSETLRALTWAMVDWEANRIRVPADVTKTFADVRVPIQPELRAILQEAPGVGRATILPHDIARLSSDDTNTRMQAYLRRIGIEPNGRSVHCFRHTAASLLCATGLGVFAVMDAVGHSSTATSKHYAHGADEFREVVARERWPAGEFFLRRVAPAAAASAVAP